MRGMITTLQTQSSKLKFNTNLAGRYSAVPAMWEAEAEGLLKTQSLRPAWVTQQHPVFVGVGP